MAVVTEFLGSIQFVTGFISLFTFVAVIGLALYYRSVKDRRGLEYVYELFKSKTDKDTFYRLAALLINRVFWFSLLFLVFTFVAYAIPIVFVPSSDRNALPAEYQERYVRALVLTPEKGNVGRAVEEFKVILRSFPKHAPSHAGLGKAYFNLRKYQESLEEYKAAVNLDPNNLSYKVSGALVTAATGNDKGAIEIYENILHERPDPRLEEKVRYSLGNSYRREGQRTGDEKLLSRALDEYKIVKKHTGEFRLSATFNYACTYALLVKGEQDIKPLEEVIASLRETLSEERDFRKDIILGRSQVECSENLLRLQDFSRYQLFMQELRNS